MLHLSPCSFFLGHPPTLHQYFLISTSLASTTSAQFRHLSLLLLSATTSTSSSYIYRNVLHIRANVRVSAMEPHIAPESVSPAPLTRLLTSIGFWASRPPPGSERERNPQTNMCSESKTDSTSSHHYRSLKLLASYHHHLCYSAPLLLLPPTRARWLSPAHGLPVSKHPFWSVHITYHISIEETGKRQPNNFGVFRRYRRSPYANRMGLSQLCGQLRETVLSACSSASLRVSMLTYIAMPTIRLSYTSSAPSW
jgi:hypothetical protein